jgi:hypothetical protein
LEIVGGENECAIMVLIWKRKYKSSMAVVDGDFFLREVVARFVWRLQSILRITGDEGAACTWACGLVNKMGSNEGVVAW